MRRALERWMFAVAALTGMSLAAATTVGAQQVDWERLNPAFKGATFVRDDKTCDGCHEEMNHKSEKCAEVLVPDRVEVRFIIGAYVSNQTAQLAFQQLNTDLPAQMRGDMFF